MKAIIVYPMNALANSQLGELEKFLVNGYGSGNEPVTFARYTGQEQGEERDRILRNPPDILLTNYKMLDQLLLRHEDQNLWAQSADSLQYLVLDEFHTYDGAQGTDVAMLLRVRQACSAPKRSASARRRRWRPVVPRSTSSGWWPRWPRLFGAEVTPERVIGETLTRATDATAADDVHALRGAVSSSSLLNTYTELAASPLASWVESTFGLATDPVTGRLIRQTPAGCRRTPPQPWPTRPGTAARLSRAIQNTLLYGLPRPPPRHGRPCSPSGCTVPVEGRHAPRVAGARTDGTSPQVPDLRARPPRLLYPLASPRVGRSTPSSNVRCAAADCVSAAVVTRRDGRGRSRRLPVHRRRSRGGRSRGRGRLPDVGGAR